jgi:hypothetical protein
MNIFIKKFLVGVAMFLGLILLGAAALYFTREQAEPSVAVNMRMERSPQFMVEAYNTQPVRYLMFWRTGDEVPLWVLDSNETDSGSRQTRLYPALFWGEVPNYMTQVYPTNNSRPRPLRIGDTLVVLVGFYYEGEAGVEKGEYVRTFHIQGPEEHAVGRTWPHTRSHLKVIPRPENLTEEVERVLAQEPPQS